LNNKTTATATAPADLLAPNGTVWLRTEHERNGSALYLPEGKDPQACSRLAMSTRMELENIFGTELHPAGGAL
jgi:hypothetical protein